MNTFKKYCENVFIAEAEEQHEKGDIIELTTKYGKTVNCEVYNLIQEANDKFYYSIVRIEDKSYAERKAEKYSNSATRHQQKSDKFYAAAQEGRDFLVLAEPIKVGHHSEGRHRALIQRNWNRMGNCIKAQEEATKKASKAEYWERKANDINLSMPESLEFYTYKLEQAQAYHKGLKDGSIEKEHSYSMQYANKSVKDLTRKVQIAQKLWATIQGVANV
jgi:hypothetical protein